MSDVPPGFIAFPTEHGDLVLAKGFKFTPKAVDLVEGYLMNKVYGRSMPCEVIQKFDLFRYNADQIPMSDYVYGKLNEAFFFADNHKRYLMDDQTICQTSGGYWKVTSRDDQVLDMNDDIIAYKNVLAFYRGKSPNGEISKYVVEEYRLNPEVSTADDIKIRNNIDNLVVCKVKFQDTENAEEESDSKDAEEESDSEDAAI